MSDLANITKKDIRDYLMANPEAEHIPGNSWACVMSNYLLDRDGIRYAVGSCIAVAPGSPTRELPEWAGVVVRAFDGLRPNALMCDRRPTPLASWEVLAELDAVLKDDPE